MKDAALMTAGIVFLTVAVLHLLRVIFKFELKIGKFTVPVWLNGIGFAFALFLSLWMFMAR